MNIGISAINMRLVILRVVWVAIICIFSVTLMYIQRRQLLKHIEVRQHIYANKVVALIHHTSSQYNSNASNRRASNSSASILLKTHSTTLKPLVVDCEPGVPCTYPETVGFRIIIMTFNRKTSLHTLLKSLDQVEGLEDTETIIEIWVDRDKNQSYDEELVKVAEAFNWTRGRVRTHVHKQHVGLYGQWIHTWRPPAIGKEIALILEDDLSVSPYIYHWLKAAHTAYGNRTDVGGYTLQSEGIPRAKGGSTFKRPTGSAFMYKLIGSWGFSPHPKIWRDFQVWFAEVRQDSTFHPYVNGLMMTSWYKDFEKKHREDSMWTQWYIYFCDKYNVYTVYNNIPSMVADKKDKGVGLAVNRREPGLHYSGKSVNNTGSLVRVWKDEYVHFPRDPVLLEWDGKQKSG